MDRKSDLQFLLDSNQTAVRRLIDDVSEEESLVRGKDDLQHIRWCTGHLVYGAYLLLKTLGIEDPMPEGWHDLFCYGCEFQDDGSRYPSMAALRERLSAYHEQINSRIADLSDADLEGTLASKPPFENMNAISTSLLLCKHEFYHAGQIAVMRRILGRERTFG